MRALIAVLFLFFVTAGPAYGEHITNQTTGEPVPHKCVSKNGGFMNTDKPLVDLSGENCPSILQNLVTNLFSGLK